MFSSLFFKNQTDMKEELSCLYITFWRRRRQRKKKVNVKKKRMSEYLMIILKYIKAIRGGRYSCCAPLLCPVPLPSCVHKLSYTHPLSGNVIAYQQVDQLHFVVHHGGSLPLWQSRTIFSLILNNTGIPCGFVLP